MRITAALLSYEVYFAAPLSWSSDTVQLGRAGGSMSAASVDCYFCGVVSDDVCD